MSIIRTLGSTELLIYLLGLNCSQNCMSIIHIKGEIFLAEIKEVMLYFQQMHPLLRAIISDTQPFSFVFSSNSAPIPISELYVDSDDSWKKEAQKELQTPFSVNYFPLMRVKLLHSPSEKQIILTYHHVIIDGVSSLNMAKELVNMLKKLKEIGTLPTPTIFPFRPTIEMMLAIDSEPVNMTHLQKVNLSSENEATYIDFRTLEEQQTISLNKFCKEQQLSLHSVIISALCLALRPELAKKNLHGRITCINAVDMRKQLESDLNSKELGYFLSRLDIALEQSDILSLEKTAQLANQKIRQAIKQRAHYDILHTVNDFLDMVSSTESLIRQAKFHQTAILVSNLGKSDLEQNSTFQINNIHTGVSCHGLLAHPDSVGITVHSFNEKLNINFHFVGLQGLWQQREKYIERALNYLTGF